MIQQNSLIFVSMEELTNCMRIIRSCPNSSGEELYIELWALLLSCHIYQGGAIKVSTTDCIIILCPLNQLDHAHTYAGCGISVLGD